jgi:uncharacterized FlaG/YvyC family protein
MAMAVDISQIAGAATDLLSSSPYMSSASAGLRRPDPEETPSTPAASNKEGEPAQEGRSDAKTYLMDLLQRAQDVELGKDTTYSFERSDKDGKVYISVKDKRTGGELYRIPKHYLTDVDLQNKQRHQVDVRI